jgi:hypothetical protein
MVFLVPNAASLQPPQHQTDMNYDDQEAPSKKATLENLSTQGVRRSSRTRKPAIRKGFVPTPVLEQLSAINAMERSARQIKHEEALARQRGRFTRAGEQGLFEPEKLEEADDSNDMDDMRSGVTVADIKSAQRPILNDLSFLDNRGEKYSDLRLSRMKAESASNAIIRRSAKLAEGQRLEEPELSEEGEAESSETESTDDEMGEAEGQDSDNEPHGGDLEMTTQAMTDGEIEALVESDLNTEEKELSYLLR